MTRFKARLIANNLEKSIEEILVNWENAPSKEDDESIRLSWTWNQAELIVFLFWRDTHEGLKVKVISPRTHQEKDWPSLAGGDIDEVIAKVADYATLAINEKRK